MTHTPDDLPEVPGLDRGEAHVYEVPELGWSAPYHVGEGVATVYVYGGAGSGEHAERVSQEFRAAVADLSENAILRGLEVVPLDKSPARVNSAKLSASALHGYFLLRGSEESGEPSRFSEIILTGTTVGFLKIRCTYAPNKPKKTGAAINRLLEAMRVML